MAEVYGVLAQLGVMAVGCAAWCIGSDIVRSWRKK